MTYIRSYLLMALWAVVTSEGVKDFLGNRNSFQDNLVSGVKNEKVLTPPSDSGLIIDSSGFPGNSNEPNAQKLENQNLPPIFKELFQTAVSENFDSNDYQIEAFKKEDFTNLENSGTCKLLCKAEIKMPLCNCE